MAVSALSRFGIVSVMVSVCTKGQAKVKFTLIVVKVSPPPGSLAIGSCRCEGSMPPTEDHVAKDVVATGLVVLTIAKVGAVSPYTPVLGRTTPLFAAIVQV